MEEGSKRQVERFVFVLPRRLKRKRSQISIYGQAKLQKKTSYGRQKEIGKETEGEQEVGDAEENTDEEENK